VLLDADDVLIGAPRNDTKGTRIGQAHLFRNVPTAAEPSALALLAAALAALGGLTRRRAPACAAAD
jgi:hypothetical protein